MFWGKALQIKVKHIGILTLVCATILVLLLQMLLLFCVSYNSKAVEQYENETESRPNMNCNVEVDHKHQLPFSHITSVITIFLMIFDIPSSVALLIGANRKLKNSILPWLVINGFKMVLIIFAICLIVWCTCVNIAEGIQFYHDTKPYYRGPRQILHHHWR